MIHNPLSREVEREVVLPLYYAGLTNVAFIRAEDGRRKRAKLDADRRARVVVKVPANGRTWLVVEAP